MLKETRNEKDHKNNHAIDTKTGEKLDKQGQKEQGKEDISHDREPFRGKGAISCARYCYPCAKTTVGLKTADTVVLAPHHDTV